MNYKEMSDFSNNLVRLRIWNYLNNVIKTSLQAKYILDRPTIFLSYIFMLLVKVLCLFSLLKRTVCRWNN
jgi:hypothetical protein